MFSCTLLILGVIEFQNLKQILLGVILVLEPYKVGP